jgi:hypothetical protein
MSRRKYELWKAPWCVFRTSQSIVREKLSLQMKRDVLNVISKVSDEVLQWKQTISPRPKEISMSKSQMKKMLITFIDTESIVQFKFILHGQIINEAYCMKIVKWMREAVHMKRPQLWPNDWSLHHNKAPVHKELSGQAISGQ